MNGERSGGIKFAAMAISREMSADHREDDNMMSAYCDATCNKINVSKRYNTTTLPKRRSGCFLFLFGGELPSLVVPSRLYHLLMMLGLIIG